MKPGAEPCDAVIRAPAFCLGVRGDEREVTEIVFLPPDAEPRPAPIAAVAGAARALEALLRDPRIRVELPLADRGTDFQRRVWRAIAAIPPGETRTYGELARELGSSARAVGQACGANPFPVVVPCHRVVAAAGLGGFARERGGYLLAAKRWLLEHERAFRR